MASQLTQLEAINLILGSAGKMPVNQIEPTTTPSARLALNILNAVHRETMDEEWDFNTEWEVELELEAGTGYIHIPTSFIRYDVPEMPWTSVRNNLLYDRIRRTNVFTSTVKGKAVLYLEWEDLPEAAKNFITKRSARRYYEQHVGSSDSVRSLYQDEIAARAILNDFDTQQGSISIFDSADMQRGLSDGNPLVGTAQRSGINILDNRTPD